MNYANVKALPDNQLIERTEYLVRRERELVDCLIWHLQEIQNRKLYIQMGYTSLYQCLVKHFKHSESVAYARISALRIIEEVPTAAESLKSGEINLTNLTLAQSFIRKQEKKTGESFTSEKKTQYIESIKNKTTDEVKQFLATMDPVTELPPDRIQYLNDDHVQLHITVDKKLLEKIEHLKALISHENLNPSYNDIFNLAVDAAIEKVEKKKGIYSHKAENVPRPRSAQLRKRPQELKESKSFKGDKKAKELKVPKEINVPTASTKSKEQSPLSAESSTQSFAIRKSRYIPRGVRRFVLQRAQHQCEFTHSDGTRCSSKFQTQFDHIQAFSKGGAGDIENIQLLCRVHNNYKGIRSQET